MFHTQADSRTVHSVRLRHVVKPPSDDSQTRPWNSPWTSAFLLLVVMLAIDAESRLGLSPWPPRFKVSQSLFPQAGDVTAVGPLAAAAASSLKRLPGGCRPAGGVPELPGPASSQTVHGAHVGRALGNAACGNEDGDRTATISHSHCDLSQFPTLASQLFLL